MSNGKSWFTGGRIALIILTAVVLLGGIGSCSAYSYANSVRSEGRQQEYAIVAQFKQNQNELSAGTTEIVEMMQVADVKKDALKEILTNAVQGRYGEQGFKANGAFFAAVHEQYPTIDLSTYDRVLTKVESAREAFKNKQDKLSDMVRAYNTYRTDGMIRNQIASKYFPSDAMSFTLAGKKYEKLAALDKVSEQVTTSDTQEAFATGTLKQLDLKGGKK